jgi:hypothetical protein
VAIFARSLPLSIDPRSLAARWLALAACWVASLSIGLLLAAAPAGAVVTTVNTGGTPRIAPNPVATNAIVSRSLASVLRNGLQVRYSVNEQVTGRFEVLLSRTIARYLGISGTLASGLPAGSAPSLVIAKAILVTTKAGRNTLKILFSKRTAARLRTLRKVSLTLRMVVRNASFPTPVSMTVLSVVTLQH